MGFRRRNWRIGVALGLALGVVAAAAILMTLQHVAIAPRLLAPYVAKRSQGHNPTIVAFGQWLSGMIMDRDRDSTPALAPLRQIGAQERPVALPSVAREVLVSSSDDARTAILAARPGDLITFLPGVYRFHGGLKNGPAGLADAPITVAARVPGSVLIEMDAEEGFKVAAPYWTFQNLVIHGVCARHTDCEHAFHVVGAAAHFRALNNTISDFNAHFKINGEGGQFPDQGLIEGNTLTNSQVRNTANPVTPIDLVAASGWVVRNNFISDFIKGDGNQVSYGAFAKGGGGHNRFEQNIVQCEQHLRGFPGQRVGLSLGGGSTARTFCRDSRCITEQEDSTIAANLILSCSDDGIYLNSAARSSLTHNTLLDTGGISVRFPTSSALVVGNLVDGAMRSRNGGLLHAEDNRSTSTALLYLGLHPVRSLFLDSGAGRLDWAGQPPHRRALQAGLPDLCSAAPRGAAPAYGAFERFSACQRDTAGIP